MMNKPANVHTPIPVALPEGILDDIICPAIPEDERIWIKASQQHNVEFRPVFFNIANGLRISVIRVRTQGIVNRHYHPGDVHLYVIKGKFHYVERPWTAVAGDYVFEPPGDIHTLTIPEDCDEFIAVYLANGAVIPVDENGTPTGYIDNWTIIEWARDYYEKVGLGRDYIDQFIR